MRVAKIVAVIVLVPVLGIPVLLGLMLMRVLRLFGLVRIDGRRQIAVSAHYIVTFFDVYLKGAPASELQSHPGYPEVEYIH